MTSEADLVLEKQPDHGDKRSPLRVRIPSKPYAKNDQSCTPLKLHAHLGKFSFRGSVHNRHRLLATTAVVLLLLVTVLYRKSSWAAPHQYSPAVQGHAPMLYANTGPTGSETAQAPFSNKDVKDALAATSGLRDQHHAIRPQPSISEATGKPFEASQHQTQVSIDQESITKAVVVAQHREDVRWLSELPAAVHQYIYQAENSTAERPVRVNQGETAVYLQYIVEQYNNLPDAVAFIHAHKAAPHMPDKLEVLNKLRWDAFEYANLRYMNITYDLWGKWTGDWLCPQNPQKAPPSDEIIWDELRVNQSQLFADVWKELFESPLGPMPQYVHSPCCAEFVVSRQRIQARPLSFYQDCLTWLEGTSSERYWAGRIFEYVWHIILGEPALYFAPDKCELLYC